MKKMNLLTSKQINIDNQPEDADKIHIHSLNNDCLIHIFEYLSIKDKIVLEDVCSRWNGVLKLVWNSVTSIKVDESFKKEYLFQDFEHKIKNTTFLIKVLNRCSNYLNKLHLNGDIYIIDYQQVIKKSAELLENVVELGLKRITVNNYDFKLLFEKNKNIRKLSLKELEIDTTILSSLNANIIEEFTFFYCEIDLTDNFTAFLRQLKNLKVLETNFDSNSTINALIKANAEDIREFSLWSRYGSNDMLFVNLKKLYKLIKKQKHLRKIKLDDISDVIDKIVSYNQADNIEEMHSIHNGDEILESLYLFKSLKVFSSYIDLFSNESLSALSRCTNLRELCLQIRIYDLTVEGENYLWNFPNLEFLKIYVLGTNFEEGYHCSLIGINKCKKLKKIVYKGLEFELPCKENYEEFSSLETFDVLYSNISTEILASIVLNSPKLSYVRLRHCDLIDNSLINMVITTKKQRNDSHVLTIEYDQFSDIRENEFETTPLVCLKFKKFDYKTAHFYKN